MKKKKLRKQLLFVGALVLLLAALLLSGLQIIKMVLPQAEQEEIAAPKLTITRGDKAYFPRQDITTLLVLGIDQNGPVCSSGSYLNQGAADLIMLLVLDHDRGVCDVLQLNRDSMVTMPVLGLGGRPAGTTYGQLALSHTYGNGLEESCENTRQTVSELLYGVHIDYYVSMHMDAIPIFNDAVGGVTVEVTEDFSEVGAGIPMGQVTLKGDQAVSFVRSRRGVGDQLNISRINRQQVYIQGFVDAYRAKRQGGTGFLLDAYRAAEPYLVTDCSFQSISAMLERYSGYELGRIVTPQGENVMGEEYMEFHLDVEALDAVILDLFYAEKE